MATKLTLGDLVYKLGFENEAEFTRALDGVLKKGSQSAATAGTETAKQFSDRFKATFTGAALGSFVGIAVTQIFARAGAALRQFASDSVTEFKRYELGLLQLRNAGETSLGPLQERIREVAEASRVFSSTDVSIAVGELVKAGYDTETAFKLVEQGAIGAATSIDAASLSFGDITETSKQLGNILRAMNYDASESGRVMDVMAKAAQDSNLDISTLVQILSRVGPTAKLANLEIEDVAAMAATLANNGMDASLIGTGLRAVLQQLINPTGALAAELDELGVSLVTREGEIRDINDVLDGLHELTERGGRGLQTLTQATGSFGSTAASTLGTGSEDVKRFRRELEDAEGSAESLADTMRGSSAGAAAEYEARLADARVELGQQLAPIMVDLYTNVLPHLISGMRSTIEVFEGAIFVFTGTTTALEDLARQSKTLRTQIADNLGANWLATFDQLGEVQERISVIRATLDGRTAIRPGALHREQLEAELDILLQQEAALQQQKATIEAARRQNELFTPWTEGADVSGPLPFSEVDDTPEQVTAAYVAAYRSLAEIRAEIQEAKGDLESATTAELERAASQRLAILENELEQRERMLGLRGGSGSTSSLGGLDPFADEAGRVARDVGRLTNLYQSERLTAEEYEEFLQAHLRRLEGLYSRVETPQQGAAVLQAESTTLQALRNLSDEQAKVLKDSERERLANFRQEQQFLEYKLELEEISLEEYRDLLAEQLSEYEEFSNEWYRLRISIADADGKILSEQRDAQRRHQEEMLRDAEDAHQRQVEAEARIQAAREAAYERELSTGDVSLGEHRQHLELQQMQFDPDTEAEWWEIQKQIDAVDNQIRTLTENNIRAQLELGEISKSEYRDIVAAWLAEYEEGTQRWIDLRMELHRVDQDLTREAADADAARSQQLADLSAQAEAEARAISAMHDQLAANERAVALATGDITRDEHMHWLGEQMTALEQSGKKFSNEWMSLWRELAQFEDEVRAEQIAADREREQSIAQLTAQAEAEAKALSETTMQLAENERRHLLELGQITREEHAQHLTQRLDQEVEYSNEWMRIWNELRTLEDARVEEIIAGEGRLTEAKRLELIARLEAERAALDASVAANVAAIAAIDAALSKLGEARGVDWTDPVANLEQQITSVGTRFVTDIVEGIKTGDIGSAMQKALGTATDHFVSEMIKGIVGPIAQNLSQSLASSSGGLGGTGGLLGGLNPLGAVLGIFGLFASAAMASARSDQQAAAEQSRASVQRTTSSAPSITYNLEANVRVESSASMSDPTFHAQWRKETEGLIIQLLERVKRT